MADFTKVSDFAEDTLNGVHNLSSHTIMLALSNTNPTLEASNPLLDGNGVLANVTQIAYTNYSDDLAVDRVLENKSVTLSGGVATFNADNLIITASGGAMETFRYIYLYNDTDAGKALVGHYDRGSALTLNDGESLRVLFDVSGILTQQ